MTLTRKKELQRPPEFRADLKRLNAEDLASASSSSSDNEEQEKKTPTSNGKVTQTVSEKKRNLPKGLPPNGKSLSRNGSKEENLLKREASPLNGTQKSGSEGEFGRGFWV